MVEKAYSVSFEIAGPVALFTRPDTGSSPISYPAPTKSSLKSMFESVVMSKEAYFEPQKIEICTPIVFHKYSTNYGGPLRKSGTVNFQLFSTVLENVCYKVYGIIKSFKPPTHGENPQHKLQEVFLRRLESGNFFSTPFLGLKEFTPSYFGPLRYFTFPDKTINMVIPSMLAVMYDRPTDGKAKPCFIQNVEIRQGVIYFDQ